MSADYLRIAAFVAYLAAWAVFAVCAVISGIPRIQSGFASPIRLKVSVLVGTILQIAPTMGFSLTTDDGPLRPTRLELAGILVSALIGAGLFVSAILAAPRYRAPGLVVGGIYGWVRHPIYLAFLAMLIATGLLASSGPVLAAAVVVYLAGCELRIRSEEDDLAKAFPDEYPSYCLRARWRYLPGLR